MKRNLIAFSVIMSIMVMSSSCSYSVWDPAHKTEGEKHKKLRNNNNKCQFSTEN